LLPIKTKTLGHSQIGMSVPRKHVPESGSSRTSAGKEIIENPSYPTHKGHLHTRFPSRHSLKGFE